MRDELSERINQEDGVKQPGIRTSSTNANAAGGCDVIANGCTGGGQTDCEIDPREAVIAGQPLLQHAVPITGASSRHSVQVPGTRRIIAGRVPGSLDPL